MCRLLMVTFASMLCIACSSGIGSYEEGVEAQSEIMAEMVGVLEGVTDEASAEKASGKIEALGNRLGELAKQVQELPKPTMEEMQEIARQQSAQQQDFQNRALPQMMKLAQYRSLSDAWTRALTNMQ